jgi:gamma-glutamylaminecyclotransferase|tara:strand:+ start:3722 stop:4129 length:408 start_codon:yes stop_codon:yes gene_type:complete
MEEQLVFVYGTLKHGHSNNVLMDSSKFIGRAITIDKFVMYQSGIPFVSKSLNTTNISGEVYSVNETTMSNLDLLEHHPDWYVREKVSVRVIDREGEIKTMEAWLYFNEEIPHSATLVKSGIYGYENKSRLDALFL